MNYTIDSLKNELERKTPYRFEKVQGILGTELLKLISTAKKTEITLGVVIAEFDTEGWRKGDSLISYRDVDQRRGYTGQSYYTECLDTIINTLNVYSRRYGWVKPEAEQIGFL